MAVIASFAFTIQSVIKAIDAAGNEERVKVSSSVSFSTQASSSDFKPITAGSRHTAHHPSYQKSYHPSQNHQTPSVAPALVTYRASSATVHSIGGGGGGGVAAGNQTTNQKSQIKNSSYGTVIPLMAVNTSAFSVNRSLTDISGQSVVGLAARRIAPPDDGGSNIGGPGNIAPPDDGGELLGSPIGDIPLAFLIILGIVYGVSSRRIRRLKQA